jgi:hypothetical protein
MTDQELNTVQKMIRFGGSFVKALGNAFIHADPNNFQKLKSAFPNYWQEYENFGRAKKPEGDDLQD